MVEARLAELGMSKTDFARKLGYVNYQGYYDLFGPTQRTKLTDKKLEQIAEVLQWPRDHFKDPVGTIKREDYIRREFQKFLQTDVGREAHQETIRILESMRWTGEFLPSKQLYVAVTIAMEGRYTQAQIIDALKLEEDDARESAVTSSEKTKRQRR
jgi:hypothetical protein